MTMAMSEQRAEEGVKMAALVVIDVSSDDEDDVHVTKEVKAAKPVVKPANTDQEPPPQVLDLDEEDEEDEEEDDDLDFSDSESLLAEWCHGDMNESTLEGYQGEMCTPTEIAYYRRRLHVAGIEQFVIETIEAKVITAEKLVTAFGVRPPDWLKDSPDEAYYRLLGMLLSEYSMKRQKLANINNIDDVVKLLQTSTNILVITGAGISTNLGIPDFRSETSGFYAKLRAMGFADPQEVFHIQLFKDDPTIFYTHCADTFPPEGIMSPTHAFIAMLQEKERLLRNYTQNIDNIEETAGLKKDKVIQCHGSWATATCLACGFKVDGSEIMPAVKLRQVPRCKACDGTAVPKSSSMKRKRSTDSNSKSKKRKKYSDDDDDDDEGQYDIPESGVMKPDITFFGEQLQQPYFTRFLEDKEKTDLVIVIGTSMKVAPVCEMPNAVPEHVPAIYISRDPCRHINFDVTLIGDCDVVVSELAKRAGWEIPHGGLSTDVEIEISPADGQVEDKAAMWTVAKKKL